MSKPKTYSVNEVFYSLQGEGHRAGTANVFVRFAGCNLQCVDGKRLPRALTGREIDAGFNCDTDFRKGDKLTLKELVELVRAMDSSRCGWVIFTGGEPTLQLDTGLVYAFHKAGFNMAVETNGLKGHDECHALKLVDWVSVSPKRGTKVLLKEADEVRVVVTPSTPPDWVEALRIQAKHYFVSPAFKAPTVSGMWGDWWNRFQDEHPKEAALVFAIEWCRKNPPWRLSLQAHKAWGIR